MSAVRADLPAEFVFEVRADVAAPLVIGPSSHGFRRVIPIVGGAFDGPRLRGRVVPGGADWQFVRPDGVFELEARYTLEAEDGTLIQVVNHAMRHGPPEVIERLLRGEPVPREAYYFRTVADFEAPIGPHDWLNKGVFVGIAERQATAAIVRFHLVL
jgi:hypothetical protein